MKKNNWVLEIVLWVLAIIVIIPFYYLLVTTFKTAEMAARSPLSLPSSLDFSNYKLAWETMNYLHVFKNNLIITACSVFLLVLLSASASYPLARRKHSVNKVIFFIILSGLMVPAQMNIIPLFKLVKGLHLMNKISGVIIIYSITFMPFAVFVYHGFIRGIPIELEEAASIDGCSVFHIYWRIIFPLLKPATATVIILNGLNIWNDFIYPLLFLQSREKGTILLEVYRNVGQFSVDWTSMFPMLVLGMLPMFVFYIMMQKHIIKGISAGAVKG